MRGVPARTTRGETVSRLPCLHTYHMACIDRVALEHSVECPVCRVDLNAATMTEKTREARGRATRDEG